MGAEDRAILEECMGVVWPLCSQVLPLTLMKMPTGTTSLMAICPILGRFHGLPNLHLRMAWTTDTPTVFTMRNLAPLSILLPQRQLTGLELLFNLQSGVRSMSSFLHLEDHSLLSCSPFLQAGIHQIPP